MKKFDRYSIRGIIFTAIGLAGIGYELLSSRSSELFVIILYGVVVSIGLLLIFRIKEYES
jgi:hypothetical protein